MRLTKETKKLYVEFFNRAAQIALALMVVGPLVTGKVTLNLVLAGIASISFSISLATYISQTLKEAD